jgi:membrane protein
MRRLKNGWRITKGMAVRMDAADLSLVAAGGAFFAMLSLFPGLAAIIALLGFIADPTIIDQQLDMLRDFVPAQAFTVLEVQIRRLVAANTSVLGWATFLSTLAALWSARRGTDALIKAINRVFHAPARGGLGANVAALMITMALIVVVLFSMIIMVFVPVVMAFVPLGSLAATAVEIVRWILAVAVVVTGIWVIYRFAPNLPKKRKREIPWFTPGSALAIVIWAGASYGFSYYLANFGRYNEIYGSIGAVIALMMFLYITIFTVLLGATLNAELWGAAPAKTIDEQAAEGETGAVPPAMSGNAVGKSIAAGSYSILGP